MNTLVIEGKNYVLIPESEFRELIKDRDGLTLHPPLKPNRQGAVPAEKAIRRSVANRVMIWRRAAGFNQQELAARAGVRPETIGRIEKCLVTANRSTISKINEALAKVLSWEKAKAQCVREHWFGVVGEADI